MPSTKLYSIKQVWIIGGITPHVLNLGIRQNQLNLHHDYFIARGSSPDIHWVICCVDLRPGLDAFK
jgi:hypothetical protein